MEDCVNKGCGWYSTKDTFNCGDLHGGPLKCRAYLTKTKDSSSVLFSDGVINCCCKCKEAPVFKVYEKSWIFRHYLYCEKCMKVPRRVDMTREGAIETWNEENL